MKSYALHDLDISMLEYLKDKKNGFYIEAGCNDGITQSNTYLLEKEYGWTGLLVDPNLLRVNECRSNRPNSIVEHCALVSNNYNKETISGNFLCENVYESLMSLVYDPGDWTNEELQTEREGKKYYFTEVEVPAITLTKLLEKHNVPKIDLLSLDVEGYEISVLNGLDFERFSPEYILIETTTHEDRKQSIHEYLTNKNYNYVKQLSINDVLYKLNS